jgi:hypothetical protein
MFRSATRPADTGRARRQPSAERELRLGFGRPALYFTSVKILGASSLRTSFFSLLWNSSVLAMPNSVRGAAVAGRSKSSDRWR